MLYAPLCAPRYIAAMRHLRADIWVNGAFGGWATEGARPILGGRMWNGCYLVLRLPHLDGWWCC